LTPKGVEGRKLFRFEGAISINDLRLMSKAIEEGCEKVDIRECKVSSSYGFSLEAIPQSGGYFAMTSAAMVTVLKMLEALPEQLQDRVVEHVRDYIEDLRDETRWHGSFSRTQESLAQAAHQARKEIAEGKATLLDIEKL